MHTFARRTLTVGFTFLAAFVIPILLAGLRPDRDVIRRITGFF